MTFGTFAHIVEIRTKTVSVSSFLIGTLGAVHLEGTFGLPRFLLMMVAVLSTDMGTTAFNTYFDFRRGTDDPHFNRERDKVLVHEGIPPGSALLVALALFGIAGIYGFALANLTGWPVIAAGVAGLLVGFLYTGGPFPISRSPFGELFAGGFLGPVLILVSGYVQSGSLPEGILPLSLPSFLLIASILTVNNTCDREGDRASGRRTLAILLGGHRASLLIVGMGAAAYTAAFLLVPAEILPPFSLPALLIAAAVSAREYRRMLRRGFSHDTKGASMGSILRIFSAWSLAAISGLAVGIAG